MPEPKTGISSNGKPMHYSAGAFVERAGRYLLIDRKNIPYGFAGLAGHIDEGEDPEAAVRREVEEESGLRVVSCELLRQEEVQNNRCGRGVGVHYWYVFRCEAEGEPVLDAEEAKSMGWYSPEELRKLSLEPVWKHWFTVLNIL